MNETKDEKPLALDGMQSFIHSMNEPPMTAFDEKVLQ
jgi:hypothetical protein